MVVLIIICYLISIFVISQSITNIEFDEYGNKYIRVRLESNASEQYKVSFNDDEIDGDNDNENEYIYIIGSSENINYKLININSNITIEYKIDDRGRLYYLLQSNLYKTGDSFKLIVSNFDNSPRSIWIRFNKNVIAKKGKIYSDTILMRKKRRYGIKINENDLPVLIKLIPNQNYQKMDLDLYGFTEKRFTTYFYPNRAERNHINNYMEQLIISQIDSYFVNDIFYFFEVYGSTDSEYNEMNYRFQIITNC